jgi:predicted nucleic-acid-binding Zn-ribbon protein
MGQGSFKCGKCGANMVRGFIADKSELHFFHSYWVEGEPATRELFGIKGANLDIQGRNRFALRSLRCEKCGFLEVYAI